MCNSFVGERYKKGILPVALEEVDCCVGEDLRQVALPKFFVTPVVHERPNNRAVPLWIGRTIFDIFGEQEIVVAVRRRATLCHCYLSAPPRSCSLFCIYPNLRP